MVGIRLRAELVPRSARTIGTRARVVGSCPLSFPLPLPLRAPPIMPGFLGVAIIVSDVDFVVIMTAYFSLYLGNYQLGLFQPIQPYSLNSHSSFHPKTAVFISFTHLFCSKMLEMYKIYSE